MSSMEMVGFWCGILISLINIKVVYCNSRIFSEKCVGMDQFDTLARSTSTVQSYLATEHNHSVEQFRISGAESRQIWMLIRHGTRRPNAAKMAELKELEELRDDIIKNFATLKSVPFCATDWQKLKQWKWDNTITDDQAQMLTTRGQEEIRSIAKTYKRMFPELLDDVYSPVKFNFKHTDTDRTRDSFNVFVDELFGVNAHLKIDAEPTEDTHSLLKPYKECAAFAAHRESVIDSDSELAKFYKTKTFQNVVEQVTRRLGFAKTLKKKQVMNMYDMCRYEQAWNKNASCVWCLMFSPDETKVLEYAKDLIGYYQYGYGSDINRRMHCSTVRDMISHLEFTVDPSVTVYFGHAPSLLLHLTAMGVFHDGNKLTARGFQKMSKRKWSTSKMSPFAGNLVAVRYSKKLVKFFLNEELIDFDWCTDGKCDLSAVRKKYKELNNCDTIYCPNDEASESFLGSIIKSLF